MTLRRRVYVTVGAALAGLVVFITSAAVTVVHSSFARVERRGIATDVHRVATAFAAREATLAMTVRDYAEWDDTVEFLAERDPGFTRENFEAATLRNLGVDAVVIRDADGSTAFATAFDPARDGLGAAPASLVSIVDRLLAQAPIARADDTRRGIVLLPEGPMLLDLEPVRATDGSGPIRGVLVMARAVDARFVEQLATSLDVEVGLSRFMDDAAPADVVGARAALAAGAPSVVTPLDASSIAGVTLLRDVFGAPALILRVVEPRDVMAQTWTTLALLVVALLGVGAGLAGLTMAMVERFAVRRVVALDAAVKSVAAAGDPTRRLCVDGSDELGNLAGAINDMLDALASRSRALQEAVHLADAANRTKSAFVANMSHELRTPLHIILGYSDMLRETAADRGDSSYADEVDRIHRAGMHLLDMVNDVLDMARMEAGRLDLRPEPVHVPEIVRDVADVAAGLASARGDALVVECARDLGWAKLDPRRVRQVLLNLLSNACKFTERGTVTLGAERTEHGLRFRVADDGIGMTAEHLQHVFEPFFQADTSSTRRNDGTGLGLAITDRLCRLMGGEVHVASAPGRGTTFVVDLPAAAA